MSIRNDSKIIIRHFLAKIIECGDLQQDFVFQYGNLASTLNLQSENYCRICCQYLNELGYVNLFSCASEKHPDSKDMKICLTAASINFLESPT